MQSDDTDLLKNVIRITSATCDYGLEGSVLLDLMKQIHTEIDDPHYDEEMCNIHVISIGETCSIETAKDYFYKVKDPGVTLWDWIVLWCEMTKRNKKKIARWFPGAKGISLEEKILDECISFLEYGLTPFKDLDLV